MKFSTLLLISLVFVCFCGSSALTAQEVYQLPNPGFEQWEKGVKMDGTPTIYDEPIGWNSFGTGIGSQIDLALAVMENWARKGNRGTEAKPNYYAIVYTGSFGNIKGNGNMTTGIINAGSMRPLDVANHNYTPIATEGASADDFRQKFTGRPDAMKVTLKYITTGTTEAFFARVSAWIHNGSAKFQDPHETDYNSKAVANALVEPSYTQATDWTEFTVPFTYPDEYAGNNPEYILISTSSNRTAGKGNAADSLYIDDLYFVYYSSLSDIKVTGTTIEGFDVDKTTYNFLGDAPALTDIEVVVKGRGASFEMPVARTLKDGSTTISITVKGNDFATSGNQTIYNLIYSPKAEVGIDKNAGDNENIYAANGKIYIENYHGSVEIYDLKGIKVYTQIVDNKAAIALPNETYVVRTAQKSVTLIVK